MTIDEYKEILQLKDPDSELIKKTFENYLNTVYLSKIYDKFCFIYPFDLDQELFRAFIYKIGSDGTKIDQMNNSTIAKVGIEKILTSKIVTNKDVERQILEMFAAFQLNS